MRRWLLLLLLLAAAAPVIAFYAVRESAAGFYSPVYSPDGSEVYFITRESEAMTAALALDFLTPTAPVYVLRDRFALWKMPAGGGTRELVRQWPPSPLEGKWIRTERERVFSTVQTRVRWSPESQLEYMVAVTDPKQPAPETWTVVRDWDPATAETGGHDDWRPEAISMTGLDEDALWEEWEVLTVPGSLEAFPCAIVAHNAFTAEFRVLLQQPICGSLGWEKAVRYSRRHEILHLQEMRSTYERLVTDAMARGLSEPEALAKANAEIKKLGTRPAEPK